MEGKKLFLGLTGSVASIKVCELIDEAKNRGMDVRWHPTNGAVPFVVSAICKKLSEVGEDSCDRASNEILAVTRAAIEHRAMIDLKGVIDRTEAVLTALSLEQLGLEVSQSLLSCVNTFEDGVDVDGYFSREKGHIKHIDVATQSDVILVAPASANTLAKIVCGITDNFLLEVIRAVPAVKRVVLALAMNTEMLRDPFNIRNMDLLRSVGAHKYRIIEPVVKTLQCGTYGDGAMESPNRIFDLMVE